MKGIMFTEILYNKTVRKEKTQTRRAGKSLSVVNESPDDWRILHSTLFSNGCLNIGFTKSKLGQDLTWHNCESNYRVGEVLYIKEPWRPIYYDESGGGDIEYKYDFEGNRRDGFPWENKMFMPYRHARAYVRITSIKCERLFSISDSDCLKEGVETIDPIGWLGYKNYMGETSGLNTTQESYFSLFRFANNYPKKKEIQNQFVWVYDYVLCDVNGREI